MNTIKVEIELTIEEFGNLVADLSVANVYRPERKELRGKVITQIIQKI